MTLKAKLLFAALLFLAVSVGAPVLYNHWAGGLIQKGVKQSDDAWGLKVKDQMLDAAKKLAVATEEKNRAEAELRDFKAKQEKNDVENKNVAADYKRLLRDAAGSAGRLRDPNAAGCGPGGDNVQGQGGTSNGNRAEDGAKTGGLLSKELSGLLQRLFSEADDINNAYASCRPDSLNLRAVINGEARN
ncbi:MAG: hypothetical protein V4614_14875 [Pseudomonadota bacterium]